MTGVVSLGAGCDYMGHVSVEILFFTALIDSTHGDPVLPYSKKCFYFTEIVKSEKSTETDVNLKQIYCFRYRY